MGDPSLPQCRILNKHASVRLVDEPQLVRPERPQIVCRGGIDDQDVVERRPPIPEIGRADEIVSGEHGLGKQAIVGRLAERK